MVNVREVAGRKVRQTEICQNFLQIRLYDQMRREIAAARAFEWHSAQATPLFDSPGSGGRMAEISAWAGEPRCSVDGMVNALI